MGMRVNVQSWIEANLNTSILSANSLPPQFFKWQELSTTTFVVRILFHFKTVFGTSRYRESVHLGRYRIRQSLIWGNDPRCTFIKSSDVSGDSVSWSYMSTKWGWVNLVQMASAHLWLEVKDMVGDSEVVLQSVKTDGKVSDNHNEDSECSSWRWWSYMMIIWLRTPEGGKEDAVSHGERQPQFLFCKIRMRKVRRRNWEWSLTG